ncbi:MAG: hypothetical protein J6M61_05345 [Bacteroidales bacterium]|nr:hypothetical protein [Bacteroidales bacterium]
MKKYLTVFLMALAAVPAAFAQDEFAASATQDTTVTYWQDPLDGDNKLLNKSKFGDNWFLGVQAGTFWSWGTNTSDAKFFKQFRPAAGLQFGKWFAPYAGARLQAIFGRNTGLADNGKSYNWNSIGGGLDGIFSFTNIFLGYKEDRPFNLIGILGAGYEHTMGFSNKSWNQDRSCFSRKEQNLISARLGMMADIRLSKALSINVEVTNNWIDDSFDGNDNVKSSGNIWDGHVNALIGLTYRFKNHDGSRQFTYARRNMSKYDILNDELNRLRAENEKKLAQAQKVVTEKKTEVIESEQCITYISFDSNSSKINRLQEVNVYTAAENMKKLSDADLYITSTEEVKNSDLFLERAQTIRDVLANTYNIPAGRIFIEKNPGVVSSLDPQKSCVIVYINE